MRDTVSSHVEQVFQVYEKHADAIGITAVLQASVVSPSVAEMLEWLQDIERHYRSSYPLRKFQTVSRAVPGSLLVSVFSGLQNCVVWVSSLWLLNVGSSYSYSSTCLLSSYYLPDIVLVAGR